MRNAVVSLGRQENSPVSYEVSLAYLGSGMEVICTVIWLVGVHYALVFMFRCPVTLVQGLRL